MNPSDFAAARGIADAVFYEGYLLYPYTATAPKNKLRWQFGVIVPVAHEAAGTGEHGHQQTDVLFESAGDPRIEVLFRFLQVESRTVEARTGETFAPVATLTVDGVHYFTFDESIEREVGASFVPGGAPQAEFPICFEGDRQIELLRDAAGRLAGRIVRQRWPLAGRLCIAVRPLERAGMSEGVRVSRLRVRVENTSEVVPPPERGVVMRTAFVSAHTLIGIGPGAFWSPIDPPDPLLAAAAKSVNEHTWPVLVGDPKADDQRAALVLSSPIVLADFPQIAQNTRADAFDGTEIDELLNLSVLSLSDAERAEARATDPRARAIVDRAEAFGAADVARTHAEFTPSAPRSIEIGGIPVAKGSSVRLVPKRRADAWDMFLAGKLATVQAIHQDLEAKLYVAVTVDDDPATEYHQWYGRSFFFEPDEVEPVGAPG
ncbi:MAG: hypothetical protein ABSB70_10510 [Candidatus Velthaea sp.]|jgi:hypothetical protein